MLNRYMCWVIGAGWFGIGIILKDEAWLYLGSFLIGLGCCVEDK